MAKRKIDEAFMKTLLVEGMPYKPVRKSSVSDEQRMAVLDEIEGTPSPVSKPPKAKTTKVNPNEVETGGIETREVASRETETHRTETPRAETPKPVAQPKRATNTPMETVPDDNGIVSMESYRDTFFRGLNAKAKTSFLADKEVLQVLRYILLDTGSATSLSDYVANILAHHIMEFKELINGATGEKLRKQTIPEL
jgi:hypothetical protein